jgi:hypothetical protein
MCTRALFFIFLFCLHFLYLTADCVRAVSTAATPLYNRVPPTTCKALIVAPGDNGLSCYFADDIDDGVTTLSLQPSTGVATGVGSDANTLMDDVGSA